MNISIEQKTFERLEKLAIGFDTPDAVIQRLIDAYENKKDEKPTLTFSPTDEKQFLSLLVKRRFAEVTLNKIDGSRDILSWEVNALTEKSNLRGNLWSGFLRGWKDKGIISADFYIYPSSSSEYSQVEIERDMALARTLGLKFSEMKYLDGQFELRKHIDKNGLLFDYTIRFYDSCDLKVLKLIKGLDENKEITFGAFTDVTDQLEPFCSNPIILD